MLYLVDGKKFVSVGPQQHVEQPLTVCFCAVLTKTGSKLEVLVPLARLFHASWTLDQRKVWLLEVFCAARFYEFEQT